MINTIHQGDCISVMRTFPANFVDTIITDAPYEFNFMSKSWDRTGIAFNPDVWKECLRVAKPGSTLMCFGGPRTFHRVAVALEDAGWLVRDVICWLFGSGFPKSLDISKAIDKAKGAQREVVGRIETPFKVDEAAKRGRSLEGSVDGDFSKQIDESGYRYTEITAPATDLAREWSGWGTALKPAWEPIIVAMKPLDGTFAENAEKWGVAGINVDGGRIGTSESTVRPNGPIGYHGGGAGGTGGSTTGRWPANLLLDEEAAAMLDGQSGELKSGAIVAGRPSGTTFSIGGELNVRAPHPKSIPADSGGASRFFYVAKASRSERNEGCEGLPTVTKKILGGGITSADHPGTADGGGEREAKNHHPTVKPLKLMEYLCTLTKTPTGGIVLDPFAGSGSTLIAAQSIGRPYIGIEMNPEYIAIANARLAAGGQQMKMAI